MSGHDEGDSFYTRAGDIYNVFRSLQNEHASINIQFNDTGNLYNSLIVDAFMDKKVILLDEVIPQDGHEKATDKIPFSIHASLNGIKIHCKNNVISKSISADSGIVYQVPFPNKLLYLQRRDSYRAAVPGSMQVQARCSSKSRAETIVARVLNMSASGFRMEIEGRPQPEISETEVFNAQLIALEGEQLLECSVNVVHSHYIGSSNKTVCGCRFTDLQRPSQITINRFVTLLQREVISR